MPSLRSYRDGWGVRATTPNPAQITVKARRTVTGVPDAIFADPRLAGIYDDVDSDRSDLDHYVAIVDELAACSVLDIGCGTGTLACRLARDGIEVTGVDPAAASIDVARRKPGADAIRWFVDDAPGLVASRPELRVDLVMMTGNVAQVFTDDLVWAATLGAARGALHSDGRLVFEVRDPSRRGWEAWNRADSFMRIDIPGVGVVDYWVELADVSLPHVTFQSFHRFASVGETLLSESTLRFRERGEIEQSLRDANFELVEVRGAPDRPGMEWVFIARPAR